MFLYFVSSVLPAFASRWFLFSLASIFIPSGPLELLSRLGETLHIILNPAYTEWVSIEGFGLGSQIYEDIFAAVSFPETSQQVLSFQSDIASLYVSLILEMTHFVVFMSQSLNESQHDQTISNKLIEHLTRTLANQTNIWSTLLSTRTPRSQSAESFEVPWCPSNNLRQNWGSTMQYLCSFEDVTTEIQVTSDASVD